MEYKDYYSILDVSKDASREEVQKAYRKLARKYHPDVNAAPDAEARFKEINEAYQVLKDPEKRAKYDQFGSAQKQYQQTGDPPPGFEDVFSQIFGGGPGGRRGRGGFETGGEGFSSFFEALFGGGGPGGGSRVHTFWGGGGGQPHADFVSQAGTDHEARISLGLREAARGGEREITLTDPADGKRRRLRVKIPKGVRTGQRIRLAGQGGASPSGGKQGDLYLVIDVRPDPDFRLEGRDLHTRLPVAPWEAALGGTARVETLDGNVTVRIPAGSSSGRRIRLRGKGYPGSNGKAGDLLAEIRIVVPETLSKKERELFRELADASSFQPREG